MQNKQVVAVAITIVLVVITGSMVLWQKQQASSLSESTQSPGTQNSYISEGNPSSANLETLNPNSQTPSSTSKTVTQQTKPASGRVATEVAQHNSKTSCWSTINGNVYDLTSWIPQHPGGERAILQICGKDGSLKFNHQHGGAPQQAMILAGFKIGIAAQ